MSSTVELRKQLEPLIDRTSPEQAPNAYYALYHDPNRSALFVRSDESHHPVGFVGRFQTGVDLFRPVICMQCSQPEIAADLLSDALVIGRPYILFCNASQIPLVGGSLEIASQRTLSIYALDPSRFTPIVNVLVISKTAQDGTPRAEIHSGGLQAAAGVNWQSPKFAELYVHTEAEARQRGWGRSVAASVTQSVLGSGRVPLYLVEASNEASINLATGLGYYDTGACQVFADVVYKGHPAK